MQSGRMPIKVLLSAAATAAAVLALGAGGAQAADICWSNPGSGEWSTASNWRGGVVPGPNDTATLNGVSGGCNLATTVTMSSDVTIGILSTVGSTRVEVAAGKTLTVKGDASDPFFGFSYGTSTVALAAGARLHIPAGALFRPSDLIEMAPTARWDIDGTIYPINQVYTKGGSVNFSAGAKATMPMYSNVFFGQPGASNDPAGRTKLNLQGTFDMRNTEPGSTAGGSLWLYPTADSPASTAKIVGNLDSLVVGKFVNGTTFSMGGPLNVGRVELTDGTLHLTGSQECTIGKSLRLFSPAVIDLDATRPCNVGLLDTSSTSYYGGRAGKGTLTAQTADIQNGVFAGGGKTIIKGAAVTGGSPGPFVREGSTLRTEGATAWQYGGVNLGAPGQAGTWENAGTLTIDSSRDTQGYGGAPLALRNNGGGTGVLRNLAGATIIRQAPVKNTFDVTAPIENAGTIDVQAGPIGAPASTGSVTQTGGLTRVASGATLDLPLTMTGGTLKGTGTVRSVLNSGGTVAPGNSPGTLTVSSDFTQGAGGTLETELAGTAVDAFDRLVVGGAATLGGTVNVLPSFAAAPGDRFKVVQSDSRSGEFATVANQPGAVALGASYQADGATLSVAGDAPPVQDPPVEDPPVQDPPAQQQQPGPGAPAAPKVTPPVAVAPPGQQTGQSTPTAAEPVKTVSIASIATGLPAAKSCVSRRDFKIRLRVPKGVKVASAEVRVAGKKVKVLKGKRLTSQVTLTGLPKGKFVVQITLIAGDGSKITGKRTYRTCVAGSKSTKKGR
jgi:hypothetical protein